MRPRLHGNKLEAFKHLTSNEERTLVIGDLHCPFDHKDALKHALDTKAKYNCSRVVFIGDLIDSHASSRHESCPNGMSAGDELKEAIKSVQKWYKALEIIGSAALVIVGISATFYIIMSNMKK